MKKKLGIGVSATFVLLIAIGWAMGFLGDGTYSSDPAVAELQRERDINFQRTDEMDDEERRETHQTFRDSIKGLSDEQRREFFESSRPVFMQRVQRRMDEFFNLSLEEQEQTLDEIIDRQEEGQGGRRGDRTSSGNRRPRTAVEHSERMKRMLDRTTPEMRARFGEFRRLLNERRKERRLPPSAGPPRGLFR